MLSTIFARFSFHDLRADLKPWASSVAVGWPEVITSRSLVTAALFCSSPSSPKHYIHPHPHCDRQGHDHYLQLQLKKSHRHLRQLWLARLMVRVKCRHRTKNSKNKKQRKHFSDNLFIRTFFLGCNSQQLMINQHKKQQGGAETRNINTSAHFLAQKLLFSNISFWCVLSWRNTVWSM